MSLSSGLLRLNVPERRSTRSREQWVQYLSDDLSRCWDLVPKWVRGTATTQIANQISLGNSKQYTTFVDRSAGKPIQQAERNVRVYFVAAILARNLEKAKRVMEAAVRNSVKSRTGLLAGGWQWYLQRGGPSGSLQFLGPSVPSGLTLRVGDALILAPKVAYAFFADYYASRKQTFTGAARRAREKGVITRRVKPKRGFGFVAYAARRLRPELRRIGVAVMPRYSTDTTIGVQGKRAGYGIPMLVLLVTRRARMMQGASGG